LINPCPEANPECDDSVEGDHEQSHRSVWVAELKNHSPNSNYEITEFRIQPFNLQDWKRLMQFMLPWYVLTLNCSSDRTASVRAGALNGKPLTMSTSTLSSAGSINSRKNSLKTRKSKRSIKISEGIRTLWKSRRNDEHLNSPYVFLNTQGGRYCKIKLRRYGPGSLRKPGSVTGAVRDSTYVHPGLFKQGNRRSG